MTSNAVQWLILCNDCFEEIPEDEIAGVFLAVWGDQGDDLDSKILLCALWEERDPMVIGTERYCCDRCARIVSVAPTSKWFIDQHKRVNT